MLLIPKRHGQRDRQTDRRLTVALPRSALASRGKNLYLSSLKCETLTATAMCAITAGCHVEVASWSAHDDTPDCSNPTVGSGLPGYVKLNGNVIVNKSSCVGVGPGKYRGILIQLIDPFNCSRIEDELFDTYADGEEAEKLTKYLDQLGDFSVVVGSMVDEAHVSLSKALDALLSFGVDLSDVHKRGSYAFVAQKTSKEKELNKATTEAESRTNPPRVNAIITGMHRGVSIGRVCIIRTMTD